MGKDIHTILEIKQNGQWVYIEDIIDNFDCRSYRFFGILENNFGHRGIPEELIGKKFRHNKYEDYWDFDFTADWLFGHSYVTLEELKNYYDNMNKVIVSEEFLEIFYELGGTLPDGMSVDPCKNKIYVEPIDEEEIYFRDFFSYGLKCFEEIAKKYNVKNDEIRLVFAFDW